jgi:hypothetical protein
MPQARDDLGRFLQPPSAREIRGLSVAADVPARIGPAEFGSLGAMVTVRCPHDLDPLMRQAGGLWEPGGRRWLIHRTRLGPLIRNLRRATDPLFRQAGMDLDGEGRR